MTITVRFVAISFNKSMISYNWSPNDREYEVDSARDLHKLHFQRTHVATDKFRYRFEFQMCQCQINNVYLFSV